MKKHHKTTFLVKITIFTLKYFSGIIAKVGVQVSDDYKAATRKIEESNAKTDLHEDTIFEVVGKELSKTWTFYCQFKTAYYRAIAYYFMGVQAEESTKIGEAIGKKRALKR